MNHTRKPTASIATRCRHIRADRSACLANARHGSPYCFFHDPNSAGDRDAARKKGGVERSRKAAILPSHTPDRLIATASDVTALLAETINQVRRGELDTRISNAVGYLASILLNAKERDEIEKRLERLESILATQGSTSSSAVETESEGDSFEFVNPEPDVQG